MDADSASGVRCPTCRALQDWADTCRRCRSDLRLLRAAAETYQKSRLGCLRAISAGDVARAQREALSCNRLRPGPEALRLLALCALLEGRWAAAAALGGQAMAETPDRSAPAPRFAADSLQNDA